MMQRERKSRGHMGVAIFAVLSVFFVLHLVLPQASLWLPALVSLAVVTMVVSHVQGGRHCSRRLARSSIDKSR
jgi:hypothetical protein